MVSWTFVELDDTGSTQAVARELASMGAPEGTTVVAESQSAGQGRQGRAWASPPGGLYMSFILRPPRLPKPELVSLVTAAAVVQGTNQSTGLTTKIRWPNDIMVGQKKLAGVIADAQFTRQELDHVVVGVGINCNSPMADSEATGGGATSLVEELGKPLEVSELKHSILDSFSKLYQRWKSGENMFPIWKEHVRSLGKTVAVKLKTDETAFSFHAVGIDAEGGLILFRDGETTILRAGDLDWLREEP
jgi:BirA family transcriptional regulator, biotin operon repressor / biotin---[acetyl-CoA-carboxylase] ligase